jgi:phosphoribosylanthranilate isomerase
MFHVKICGVTTAADARLATAAGADAVGVNFVPGSPRCVTIDAARAVAAAVPAGVLVVGVFAGATADEMRRVAREVGLGAIQLHGHLAGDVSVDRPELCAALAPVPIIRAIRLGDDGLETARRWITAAARAGRAPDMALVDAAVTSAAAAGSLGGTGATVDWERLAAVGGLGVPTALAGGLTPVNVAEAIRVSRVVAVDTASGVESSPGRKDPEKVRAFVAAARRAMTEAGG